MKTIRRLAFVITANAAAFCSAAESDAVRCATFLKAGRIELGGPFESKRYGGVGVTARWETHELVVEASQVALDYREVPAPGIVGGTTTTFDGRLRPLTVGYRFNFPIGGTAMQAFVGPNLGYAKVSGTAASFTPVPNGLRSESFSKWRYVIGGDAGLLYPITTHLQAAIGYSYVSVDKLGRFNDRFEVGSVRGNAGYVSLKYTF